MSLRPMTAKKGAYVNVMNTSLIFIFACLMIAPSASLAAEVKPKICEKYAGVPFPAEDRPGPKDVKNLKENVIQVLKNRDRYIESGYKFAIQYDMNYFNTAWQTAVKNIIM